MKERQRLDLIRKIEKKRGSRVIAYVTGTRPGHGDMMDDSDVRVIEHHLDEIFSKKAPSRLDLFLYTPGGYIVVPTTIVALIREYLGPKGEFSVLIPSMAYSSGTILSLGADEIIMGPGGHLGPIDTQSDGVPVDIIHDYFDLARSLGLKTRRNVRDIFLKLTDDMHPLMLGSIHRTLKEGERRAMRVLSTRKNPLSNRRNRKIVKFLTSDVGLHGQAIHRSEARENGLDFVKNAESYDIRNFMSELFSGYEQMLDLDLPLVRPSYLTDNKPSRQPGDEADRDTYGNYIMEAPLSVVESLERLDIAKLAYGSRFWRDAPKAPRTNSPQGTESAVLAARTGTATGQTGPARLSSVSSEDVRRTEPEGFRVKWEIVRRSEDAGYE